MDTADEPLLVRGAGRGGEAEVQAERGRPGGPRPGRRPVEVRVDKDGRCRRTSAGGRADIKRHGAKHKRRAEPVGHERERENHVQGGTAARHRVGASGAPGLPVYARRGWGRSGV